MVDNNVLFETKVCLGDGAPYLSSKRKVKFFVTGDEIRLIDPKWVYVIPLNKIYDCSTKPLSQKRVIYNSLPFSSPTMIEVMNNFLLIDYLDDHGQRNLLHIIFAKYFWIKSNVVESIRFTETIEKYQLRDKFIKNPPTTD